MYVRNTHTELILNVKCCLVPRTLARHCKEWKMAVLEAIGPQRTVVLEEGEEK